MVRTYWLVPVFYEASGHLDLRPFARTDRVEACRPRAMWTNYTRCGQGRPRGQRASDIDPTRVGSISDARTSAIGDISRPRPL